MYIFRIDSEGCWQRLTYNLYCWLCKTLKPLNNMGNEIKCRRNVEEIHNKISSLGDKII